MTASAASKQEVGIDVRRAWKCVWKKGWPNKAKKKEQKEDGALAVIPAAGLHKKARGGFQLPKALQTKNGNGNYNPELLIIADVRFHVDETNNLHLLTAGPISPELAELRAGRNKRAVFPPWNPPSPLLFSNQSVHRWSIASIHRRSRVVVIHGRRSSHHVVKRSRQLLLDVGAKILRLKLA